ncbi:MAG: hypothetical protein ACFE0O_12590 [Opitutales bacterium]
MPARTIFQGMVLVFLGLGCPFFLLAKEPLDADRNARILRERPDGFTREAFDVQAESELMDHRIPIKEWSTFFSPLGQRRAALPEEAPGFESVREKKQLTFPLKLRGSADDPDDQPVLTLDVDRIREAEPSSRFADAAVVTVDLGRAGFEAIADELSMQDINRYQFDRNRSSEPGLPVQRPRPGRADAGKTGRP